MLVAQTEEGLISLAQRFSLEQLKLWKKEKQFYCPSCQSPVQLKLGTKKIPHFAHLKKTCVAQHEGETDYHLDGKRNLFHWFSSHLEVELESYLPDIMQRPDLLVDTPSQKYAIEFQCASLSSSALTKRSIHYEKGNYMPLWIMGAKRMKRLSTYMYQLSFQEWQFLTLSDYTPTLLYFSPSTNQLLKLEHLIPFSSQICYAQLVVLSPHEHTFHDLFSTHTQPQFFSSWIKKKKAWRTHYILYPNQKLQPFLHALYENNIPPSHIPAEAGMPLPSLYMVETSAIIWQTWLLLDLMQQKQVGDLVTEKELGRLWLYRIHKRHIVFRSLPMAPVAVEQPLFEYIEVLCRLGMLTYITSGVYKIRRPYTIPKRTSNAFLEDGQMMKRWLNQAKEVT